MTCFQVRPTTNFFTEELTAADEAIAELEAAIARARREQEEKRQQQEQLLATESVAVAAARQVEEAIALASKFGESAAEKIKRGIWALVADIEFPAYEAALPTVSAPKAAPTISGDDEDDSEIIASAAAMYDAPETHSDQIGVTATASIYIEEAGVKNAEAIAPALYVPSSGKVAGAAQAVVGNDDSGLRHTHSDAPLLGLIVPAPIYIEAEQPEPSQVGMTSSSWMRENQHKAEAVSAQDSENTLQVAAIEGEKSLINADNGEGEDELQTWGEYFEIETSEDFQQTEETPAPPVENLPVGDEPLVAPENFEPVEGNNNPNDAATPNDVARKSDEEDLAEGLDKDAVAAAAELIVGDRVEIINDGISGLYLGHIGIIERVERHPADWKLGHLCTVQPDSDLLSERFWATQLKKIQPEPKTELVFDSVAVAEFRSNCQAIGDRVQVLSALADQAEEVSATHVFTVGDHIEAILHNAPYSVFNPPHPGDHVINLSHPECGVGIVDKFDEILFQALKRRYWYVNFPESRHLGGKGTTPFVGVIEEGDLHLQLATEPQEQHLPLAMFELVKVSDRVGYLRDNRDESIAAAYVGLDTDEQAAYWKWHIIDASFRSEGKVTARTAKRLPFNIELKITNIMGIGLIDWLAQQKLTDIPTTEPEQVSAPAEEVAPEPEAIDFEIGNVVALAGADIENDAEKGTITAISKKKKIAQIQWHSGFKGAVALAELKLVERKGERYYLRPLDSSRLIGPFPVESLAITHLREKGLGEGVVCSLAELNEWHQVYGRGLLPTGWYIFIDSEEPSQLFGAFETPEDAISYAEQKDFLQFQVKSSGYLWSLKNTGVAEISFPEGCCCKLPSVMPQLPPVDLIEIKLLAGAIWLELGIPSTPEALEHYRLELNGEALERFEALRTFQDLDSQRALKIKWQLDRDAAPEEFSWWENLGGASKCLAEDNMTTTTSSKLYEKLDALKQSQKAVLEVPAPQFFREGEDSPSTSTSENTGITAINEVAESAPTDEAAQSVKGEQLYVAWFHAGDNFKMPIKIVGPVEFPWQLEEIEQASSYSSSSYSVARWTEQDYQEMHFGKEAEPYQAPKWVTVNDHFGYFQKGDNPSEASKIYLGFSNLKTARGWAQELVNAGVIAAEWETAGPSQVHCKHELVVRPGTRHDALGIIKKLPLLDKPDREVIQFIADNPLSPYYLKKLPPQDLGQKEQRFAVYPTGYSEAKRHGEIWTPAMFPGKWESSRTYSPVAPNPWDSRDLAALATLNLVKPETTPASKPRAEVDAAAEYGGFMQTDSNPPKRLARSNNKVA